MSRFAVGDVIQSLIVCESGKVKTYLSNQLTSTRPLGNLLKERYGLCRRRVDIDFVAIPENRFQVSGCVGEDGIHGLRSIVTECAYNCFGRAFVWFTSD